MFSNYNLFSCFAHMLLCKTTFLDSYRLVLFWLMVYTLSTKVLSGSFKKHLHRIAEHKKTEYFSRRPPKPESDDHNGRRLMSAQLERVSLNNAVIVNNARLNSNSAALWLSLAVHPPSKSTTCSDPQPPSPPNPPTPRFLDFSLGLISELRLWWWQHHQSRCRRTPARRPHFPGPLIAAPQSKRIPRSLNIPHWVQENVRADFEAYAPRLPRLEN